MLLGCLRLTDTGLYTPKFGDDCRTTLSRPSCKYTGMYFYALFFCNINFVILLAVLVLIHFQNDSACMTTEGRQCLFPFKYRNRTDDDTTTELIFNKCSTLDIYRPWCPTSKNELSILYK